MHELYQEAIRLINFPLTVMVVLVVLYWIFVILGFLDIDLLDFDLELDADGAEPGFFGKLAQLCHFGDAPFFVILSILFTSLWTISLLLNFYLNPNDSILLGLVFLVPNVAVSLVLTSIVVYPVHLVFKKLNEDDNARKTVVGEICEVTTSRVDRRSGGAAVPTEAAPIVINARTTDDKEILEKGDKAIIVRMNDDGTYIIKKLEE